MSNSREPRLNAASANDIEQLDEDSISRLDNDAPVISIFREHAIYALRENLLHTKEEATEIVNDPHYTVVDLLHIPTISLMLRHDLLPTIESFYDDVKPIDPTCEQIRERIVARFPEEPIVFKPFSHNATTYERGPEISRGLVRRLLRAKAFKKTCEASREDTISYHRADESYTKCFNASLSDNSHCYLSALIQPDTVTMQPSANTVNPIRSPLPESASLDIFQNSEMQLLAFQLFLVVGVGACLLSRFYNQTKSIGRMIAGIGIFNYRKPDQKTSEPNLLSIRTESTTLIRPTLLR
jgi:hypothetical protein